MFPTYQSSHRARSYLDAAIQGRAEAQGRAAYLAIVAVEAAARILARTVLTAARRIAEAHRRRRDRRLTIKALSGLDERLLRDVGVDPNNLPELAAELAGTKVGRVVPDGGIRPRAETLPYPELDRPGIRRAA